MKSKTLAILAFSFIAAPIFCGNNPSISETKKRIKIANEETLKLWFNEREDIREIDLTELGIYRDFCEKEFSDKAEIEKVLDTTLNSAWENQLTSTEKKIGKEAVEKTKKKQYEIFTQQYNKIKPTLLKLLVDSSEQIEDQ